MEILTMLLELIPSVGFPITCVVGLAFFIYKIYQKSEDREDKLNDRLDEAQKLIEMLLLQLVSMQIALI